MPLRKMQLVLCGFMPGERIEFTLKRPVFRLFDESVLDRIFPKIKPFLAIAFAVTQLAIKKILLPDWLFRRIRPVARHVSPPELNPLFERRDWHHCGRAEKMNVIWHDNIASHQPVICFTPGIKQQSDDTLSCKQQTALVRANSDELENRLVCKLQRSQMRRSLTTGFAWLSLHF